MAQSARVPITHVRNTTDRAERHEIEPARADPCEEHDRGESGLKLSEKLKTPPKWGVRDKNRFREKHDCAESD
jgi:hypothetical protein